MRGSRVHFQRRPPFPVLWNACFLPAVARSCEAVAALSLWLGGARVRCPHRGAHAHSWQAMAASYDPNFEFNAPKVPPLLMPALSRSSCAVAFQQRPISGRLLRPGGGCSVRRPVRPPDFWTGIALVCPGKRSGGGFSAAATRVFVCPVAHAANSCPPSPFLVLLQFHDFTNPCQDDDADLFFDTCNHESLPTGASSVQHVTAQQGDEHGSASEERACDEGAESKQGAPEAPAEMPVDAAPELAPAADVAAEPAMEAGDAEETEPQTRLASAKKSASNGVSAGGSKQNSKLTESIIALAGFKGKEAELTLMAESTVATAVAAGDDAPVAARTRTSLEGPRASQGEGRSQASAQKGAASPGVGLRASASGSAGLKSDEKKRAHKTGASTTPAKSFAKKPRTEETRDAGGKESKTPNFARFGGARGRTAGVSSTPNGRSSSAPATGRPSMTPRSARKTVCAFSVD